MTSPLPVRHAENCSTAASARRQVWHAPLPGERHGHAVAGALGAWVPGCLGAWVPGCLGAWVPGCLGGHTGVVRITVRVRPGSARPGVGGAHDGALVVRVSARAVDGQATAAALAAVAAAFGVRPHAVTLVAGAASRTKIIDVAGADQAALEHLLAL
jgi:uncharacterized protein YggU (UPF0235/DUF167 family)